MKLTKRLMAACLVLVLCLSAFSGCKEDGGQGNGPSAGTDTTPTATNPAAPGQPQTYTIQLVSEAGTPFTGVGIYIYEDATQEELVWFAKTNDAGAISFTAPAAEGYVAILDGVADGYAVAENYPLSGADTVITLEAAMISGEDYIGKKFGLGDVMWDLTVTDLNGKTYQLSQLLEENEAVMLNFWYIGCVPCRMEFPYLQQAYVDNADQKIALIAINTMDSDAAAVQAFAEENGLTFPVAQGSEDISNALGITNYPTTVVIDRFGIITLKHEGGIEGAGAFGDVMNHFLGDDYQSAVITDVNTIITPEDNNDEIIENPTDVGGVKEFQLTVRPGETVYCNVYKANEMYLTIQDETAELAYNGKTYTYQNGRVRATLYCKDTYTPATIALKNVGTETTTYTLKLSSKAGSLDNPYKLSLGEFDVSISSGKEEGLYYNYTAQADGYLVLECLSATSGVPYGYSLYNMSSYAMRNLEGDAVLNDEGKVVVRMPCRKGQKVQFNPSALPDDGGSYPSIKMRFLASFTEGLEDDGQNAKMITYGITVVGADRVGISGVFVDINTGDGKTQTLTTNDQGLAAVKLAAGNYTATVRLPSGYTARTTKLSLTENNPAQSVKLDAVVVNIQTYTVTVTDDNGAAMENVMVTIGDTALYTDASGVASFELEQGSYTAVIDVPEGYTSQSISYDFPEGGNALTIQLTKGSAGGEEENKIDYTVKIVDYYGVGVSGVNATFFSDGKAVALARGDASGVATAKLAPGVYTAKLVFSKGSYIYDEAQLVFTQDAPEVTVSVIAKLGKDKEDLYVGTAYFVNVGATYIEGMQTDITSYFMFQPSKSGYYKITTTDPAAAISYWGGNRFYIADQTGAVKVEGENALMLEVREEYLNDDTVYILGITGADKATLLIERTGDIILTDEEKAEWIIYEAKEPAQKFSLKLNAGEKLTYLDLTSQSITLVKGADGYYHLNDETGPILYVNLGTDGRYMPFHAMLGFEQAGGTGFQCVFYEGEQFIKKEDYTECMQSFVKACVDSKGYGVYPLNDDLIYMIQNGGAAKGWYDSEDPGYLFGETEGLNPDILWMFPLMYISK